MKNQRRSVDQILDEHLATVLFDSGKSMSINEFMIAKELLTSGVSTYKSYEKFLNLPHYMQNSLVRNCGLKIDVQWDDALREAFKSTLRSMNSNKREAFLASIYFQDQFYDFDEKTEIDLMTLDLKLYMEENHLNETTVDGLNNNETIVDDLNNNETTVDDLNKLDQNFSGEKPKISIDVEDNFHEVLPQDVDELKKEIDALRKKNNLEKEQYCKVRKEVYNIIDTQNGAHFTEFLDLYREASGEIEEVFCVTDDRGNNCLHRILLNNEIKDSTPSFFQAILNAFQSSKALNFIWKAKNKNGKSVHHLLSERKLPEFKNILKQLEHALLKKVKQLEHALLKVKQLKHVLLKRRRCKLLAQYRGGGDAHFFNRFKHPSFAESALENNRKFAAHSPR